MSDKYRDSAYVDSGVLSDVDIIREIQSCNIMISNFDKRNLTPLGYNLTPSRFVFSIKKRTIEKIHREDTIEYVFIRPNDTVLILSRESLFVSNKIMGTFHSKVGVVSFGLGHVSTTLDPYWEGPLLFSINNPTSKRIKLTISQRIVDTNKIKHKSFVTVIFQYLKTPSCIPHDNPIARMSILREYINGRIFVYKDLQKFCEEIDVFSESYKHTIAKEHNKIIGQNIQHTENLSGLRKQFKKKYENYLHNVNNAVDKIGKINRWVVLFNYLKRKCFYYILLIIAFLLIYLGLSRPGFDEVGVILITSGFAGCITLIKLIISRD